MTPAENSSVSSTHDRLLGAAKRLFSERGYENTSTVAIARQAGTSESQLIKHFGSKEGLLEAIFEDGWAKLGQAFVALDEVSTPIAKLRFLIDSMLTGLNGDPELKQLLLLEGRRIRKEGRMVMLTQGFRTLVQVVDGVLLHLSLAGQLRPGLSPELVRSSLFGMMEGLLRDQVLTARGGYQVKYDTQDIRRAFDAVLGAFIETAQPAARSAPRERP